MSRAIVLVTGANGEIGRSLIRELHSIGRYGVVTLDLTPLPEEYRPFCVASYAGNIMDRYLLDQIAYGDPGPAHALDELAGKYPVGVFVEIRQSIQRALALAR